MVITPIIALTEFYVAFVMDWSCLKAGILDAGCLSDVVSLNNANVA